MDVAEVGGRTMQSERRVERTGPAHQSPEDQLYELLIRLIRELARLEPNRPEGGDPLSLSERFALSVLAESQPLTQSEVAERLGLEKSTVSRLVARLEREELITRERKVGNRRLYQLTLTASG